MENKYQKKIYKELKHFDMLITNKNKWIITMTQQKQKDVRLWLKNEIIHIATDEKHKTFFKSCILWYMIDTIVVSFGRVFVGTYFSTFSGFINRMRGYYGMSMNNSWYIPKEQKTIVYEWSHAVTYARKSPDGWVRIDADEFVDESDF